MRRYYCSCGQAVYFDNTQCTRCGSLLGFDAEKRELRSIRISADRASTSNGETYRVCRNTLDHANCNWLINDGDASRYCVSCRLNRTIPNLAKPENAQRWHAIESAKRRLLYSLLSFNLPLTSGHALAFDFIEDKRTNASVTNSLVTTHHVQGVITINVAEADDVARTATREQLQERYRTLLGHFRHESAHFYFTVVIDDGSKLEGFRALFGDERADYDSALASYYRDGVADDWQDRFVSAYASAHPAEDWAETWAHYLHMHDCLETAHALDLVDDIGADFDRRLAQWVEFSVSLNELNRSMGLDDAYPFVIPRPVARKLGFVHELLQPG